MDKRTSYFLVALFIFACLLRFLYFPQNIYFGFDQARDAFTSLQVWGGKLKLIGPPTSIEGLFHGPLYYYIFAPFYGLFSGNPQAIAAFLRIFNSLGIFLAFALGFTIFGLSTGIITALLFAFSFEQTQYAIYINHPAFANLTVPMIYLGFALLLFRKKSWGLIVAMLSLGLSIAFEMIETYQIFTAVLIFIAFGKSIFKQKPKTILLSLLAFILPLSSFILAEFKYQFRSFGVILSSAHKFSGELNPVESFKQFDLILNRFIHDNIIASESVINIVLILFLIAAIYCLRKKDLRSKIIFLSIWLLSGILPYAKDTSLVPIYHYGAGASASLLIFGAFLIKKLGKWQKLGYLVLLIPLLSNLYLITQNNPSGSIPAVNVQSGMLLEDEKQILDYIYNQSAGNPFSVSALSMPLNVNTTWSYLFEQYGYQKYHYLPVWGGEAASGYPGHLKVEKARSKLPEIHYAIIEPKRGIPDYFVEGFLNEESYFSNVIDQKQFGAIIVQKRIRI